MQLNIIFFLSCVLCSPRAQVQSRLDIEGSSSQQLSDEAGALRAQMQRVQEASSTLERLNGELRTRVEAMQVGFVSLVFYHHCCNLFVQEASRSGLLYSSV